MARRNRRLAKDFEAAVALAEAFLYAASSMLLLRRLGRCQPDSEWALSRERSFASHRRGMEGIGE
jgi:hypothetical protein